MEVNFCDLKFELSEKCWLPDIRDGRLKNPNLEYSAGKAIAEQSVWKILKCRQTGVHFITVLLLWVFGLPIHSITISSLNACLRRCPLSGQSSDISLEEFIQFANVRNLAKAHIAVVEELGLDGKRCLVVDGNASSQSIVDTPLRSALASSILKGNPYPFDLTNFAKISDRESEKHMKFECLKVERPLPDSVRLLKLKKKISTQILVSTL